LKSPVPAIFSGAPVEHQKYIIRCEIPHSGAQFSYASGVFISPPAADKPQAYERATYGFEVRVTYPIGHSRDANEMDKFSYKVKYID